MFSKLFLIDAAERLVKTFAQAVLAIILVAPHTPVIGFDWPTILATGATAAVISLLTSIVSAGVTGNSATVSPASIAPTDRGV